MKSVAFAAILAASLAAQTQPQGSMEGQVLNAATGAPLKKTTVRLNGISPRNTGQGRGGQPIMPAALTKETDEQGHFAFTGLEAGRYSLSAQRAGFLRTSYGARRLSGNGVPIVLGQDQHLKDLTLKMSPQSVIVGKVLDEDGDPVNNVQVRVLRSMYRNGKRQWNQTGGSQTSDIGEYRIANLEPGRYLVATSPRNNGEMMQSPTQGPLPDKPESVSAPTYYPNSLDSNGAAPIDVGPGAEVRGIDIHLRKVQAFRIRGKVTFGGDQQRPAGVMVMVSPKDGTGQIQAMSMARPPEGRFEVSGIPAGSYIIHARVNGPGQQAPMAFQVIDVNNHVDNLVLTPSPSIDIPGSIKIESDAQVDLKNINVNTRPIGFVFGGAARARAGDDLKFVLKNVNPSRFAVNVSGLPPECFVKSIRYAGQEVTADGVDAVANAPIEITLSATAGQVTGTVSDKDGKPSAASTVVLLTPGKEEFNSMTTDENGAFTFRGLKPGDYKLIAWEDVEWGAWQDPDFMKQWESKTVDVKIDPSGKQTATLKAN